MAGVYGEEAVPPGLGRDEAIEHARNRLLTRWKGRHKGCLTLSRREKVWFETDGSYTVESAPDREVRAPETRLRGKAFSFTP